MAINQPRRRSECWWWRERQPSDQAIRLESLSLQTLIKHVPQVAKDVGRNIRKKKALCQYFSYSLLISLQKRLFEKAVENLEDADAILNLLFMFQPFHRLTARNIDLCGKFRYSIDLKMDDINVTTDDRWYPFYTFHPLTSNQLANLYNILQFTKNINMLEGISFAVEDDALKKTNLCHVLARAHSLTRVVILKGADNHTLRILGLNCPSLKHLDVTHSWSVSDAGLRNLLLKRPRRLQPNKLHHQIMTESFVAARLANRRDLENDHLLDKNECFASLEVLILTGTQVTYEGCNFAGWCMHLSFLHVVRPIIKIARMKMKFSPITEDLLQPLHDAINAVTFYLLIIEPTINIDSFPLPPRSSGNSIQSVPDQNRTTVAYGTWPGHLYVCVAFKFEGTQVTSLVLPFYSLEWDTDFLIPDDNRMPLRTLADNFPNLVCFRGCLKGRWNEDPLVDRQVIHLKNVNAWALTSAATVSLLRHCSSLKILEYNHLEVGEEDGDYFDDLDDIFDFAHGVPLLRLGHAELEGCLQVNPSLEETLEEITLRPAKRLGPRSLSLLVERCRNLRRIGDLQTWNLTKADIEQLTTTLERNGCVPPTFALFNLPPSNRASEEWDSWMAFE